MDYGQTSPGLTGAATIRGCSGRVGGSLVYCTREWNSMRRILLVLLAAIWVILVLSNYAGRDYYPLYWGAQQIWEGRSPYGPEATARLAEIWATRTRFGGVAYPLPVML